MRYIKYISIILLTLFSVLADGQVTVYGDDIREAIKKRGQAEVVIAYPGFKAMSEIASRFSVSACDGRKATLSLSPLTMAEFIGSGIAYNLINNEGSKAVYTASSVSEAMQWHSYPTWQQYDTIMHKLAETWSDVCILDTIGYSVMGRAILVLKISDNPGVKEDEPVVMYSSSMHGDEIAGFVIMMRLAEYLTSGSNDGGLAERLTSGLEIWINPLSNPDGMYRSDDTIITPTRTNENGYDLNRNFPDAGITSPAPLQPETLCMMSFLREKHFNLSVNFHSGGEVVNYPWDKWEKLHADNDWYYHLCRRYADTVHLYSPHEYMNDLENGVTNGAAWYIVLGGRQDYVTYELGGREITIEIHSTKQTPATDLETLWNYNYRSLLLYLEEALFGIRGTIISAADGLPLGAKVFINGYDKDSSHVYSDTLTGTFYRFLEPGTWNLAITCDGYDTLVCENVVVTSSNLTTLNIELEPVIPVLYPEPPVKGLLIYPVPTDGHVLILPPEVVSGNVSVTVVSSAGSVIKRYSKVLEPGIPFDEDFTHLSAGFYFVEVKKLPDGPRARGKVSVTSGAQR